MYGRAKEAILPKAGAATDAAVDRALRLVDHHADQQLGVAAPGAKPMNDAM